MIPTQLQIRNFMCYREPVDLDFRGLRLACLSGDNGAGKSALLDAITWALWGKARVNSDQDLMALGTSDMEVTFGFLLDGQEYRVIRRRTQRGAGKLTLELNARDGDRWRVLSGSSVRETQAAISSLLCMDYDTFVNSAFILQGRADEFTTKTPAERKQVLADILRLEDYDRFAERAKDQAKACQREIEQIDGDLTQIDARLAEMPRHEADMQELGRRLLTLADELDNAIEHLQQAQGRVQTLELIAAQHAQLSEELSGIADEISSLGAARDALARTIAEYREILRQRDNIERRHSELKRLRGELDTFASRAAEREGLTEERRRLEGTIHYAETEARAAVEAARRLAESQRAAIATKPGVTQRLTLLEAEIARLAAIDGDIDAARARISEMETRRGELLAENRRLKADMEAIKARMEQIGEAGALCPVCRRPIGAEEHAHIQLSYQQEGTALGDQFRANRAMLQEIDADREARQHEVSALEAERQRRDVLGREYAALRRELETIEQAEANLARAEAEQRDAELRIERGDIAAAERERLREVIEALARLPYDREAHAAVVRRVRELEPVEEQLRALDTAAVALANDERRLADIVERVERLDAERERKSAMADQLAGQIGPIATLRQERDDWQDRVDRLTRERGDVRERFGAAQQRLKDCQELALRRDDLVARRREIVDRKDILDQLTIAFGKKGIQAMIIDTVVPEIQAEANAILDQMPNNTMRVEFQTQRQAKKGDGPIETLDIIIGDEAGRRRYELYSGGEAFRANFAIRIALSTLLARRAGARLQTLVIDEGFGTQDVQGLDGLVEAIHAIEPDFQMILVITHIASLKDRFPNRIDVVKTPGGSRVYLN